MRRWFRSVLLRSSARYSIAHPWQFGLSILGIALGVAVVISITQAGESAKRAFELSSRAITGSATHQLIASSNGFDEVIYRKVRAALPGTAVAPIIEGHVVIPQLEGRAFTLLGVDPLSERPFRAFLSQQQPDTRIDLAALMSEPASVIISSILADTLGLQMKDRLDLQVAGRSRQALVAGIVIPTDALAAKTQSDLIIADISTAQELLHRVGRLDRIDLIVAKEREPALQELMASLASGTRLISADHRFSVTGDMTRAFNLNLVMLSLLALAVGMFLIYNTVSFSVVQRRALIGNLRALGVTRGQIFTLILVEAAGLGILGSILGVGMGVVLSTQLIKLVSQTINDLYFVVNIRNVGIDPATLVKGAGLGVGASILAATVPALEATTVAPRVAFLRSVVESKVRRLAPRAAVAGAGLLAVSVLLVLVPWGDLGSGFSALFGLVIGFALLTPYTTMLLIRLLQPLARRLSPSLGPLAVQGVTANLSRTSVAIAALMVALAAGAGVGVMVDSFRQTVAEWLAVTLKADVYVSLANAGGATIDAEIVSAIESLPEIRHVSMGRTVTVESAAGPVDLQVLKMAPDSYQGFRFLEGDRDQAWAAFDNSDGVLVSEPFAWHRGTGLGDEIHLLTDRRARGFAVHGVIRDYGSERGVVLMSHTTFEKHWHTSGFTTLGLYAREGADIELLIESTRVAIGDGQALRIRSNRGLREASMAVFDRTFTITIVLRILATVVAFVGVLSAFMILQLERAREVAVLRALGMTRGQVWGVVGAQTGLMGLITGVLAIPLSFAMALMLIGVINRRSFGWSIDFHADPSIVVQTLGLAVVAALVAGLYPAFKMTATEPGLALRED